MRSPLPFFRSELEAYRRRLVAEKADDWQTRLIDNWRDHGAVETTWNKIREKLAPEDMPTAEEFIWLVLNNRIVVANGLARVNRESPAVEAAVHARADKFWDSGNYSAATTVRSQLNNFREERSRLLGRKPKDAPRKRFMKGWSDKFTELCGQPLYEVVLVLTEVAFGREVTPGAVRGAHRPTTRQSRSHKARPARTSE
jgi:hypothetical protein